MTTCSHRYDITVTLKENHIKKIETSPTELETSQSFKNLAVSTKQSKGMNAPTFSMDISGIWSVLLYACVYPSYYVPNHHHLRRRTHTHTHCVAVAV